MMHVIYVEKGVILKELKYSKKTSKCFQEGILHGNSKRNDFKISKRIVV
jgi:hypothetical protein